MNKEQALTIIKQVVTAHVDTIQGHNVIAEAVKVLEEAITPTKDK